MHTVGLGCFHGVQQAPDMALRPNVIIQFVFIIRPIIMD